MSVVLALLMPPTMLALLFFLARIEERHLTVRPRVADVAAADGETPTL